MHVHAVLLTLKPDAEPGGFEAVVEALQGIVGQVDGVLSVYGGPNKSDHETHFTHSIVVLMDTHSVLQPYRAHPLHDKAVPILASVIGDSASMDIGDA